MRRAAAPILLALIALAVESGPASANGCLTGTAFFAETDAEQCYTVPAGISGIHVVAIGAPGTPAIPGAIAAGGLGTSATADFTVTPGQTLFVEVGGAGTGATGGFNGGGTASAGDAGGGGGGSDFRTCSSSALSCPGGGNTLGSRLLVAGGGGGGGSIAAPAGSGGSSAGVAPQAGGDGTDFAVDAAGGKGGQPGTTATGGVHGAGGAGTLPAGGDGADGQLGLGGDGGGGCCGGGGGGGGYYGGGGGGGGGRNNSGNAGGGGGGGAGSSFADPAGTGATLSSDASGTPSVTITPIATPVPPGATTAPASELGPEQATLNGVVNPKGVATTYQFEYVDAAGYQPADPDPYAAGTASPSQPAGSGSENQLVQYTATGLSPGTTYHFRLAATSTAGTAAGVDRVFTTPDAPPASADVRLSQTAEPGRAPVGHNFRYTLVVHNSGPSDATSVALTDPLPGNARLQSANPSSGTCTGKATVICQLGGLASNTSAKVRLVVRAVHRGALVNTALATADQPDPDTANNSATTKVRATRSGTHRS